MSNRQLLYPDLARNRVARHYNKQQKLWLAGSGEWPLEIGLGQVREQDAINRPDVVSNWIKAWQQWESPTQVCWREVRWHRLGVQRIPEKLAFNSAEEAAEAIGELQRWRKATYRFAIMCKRFPQAQERLPNLFDVLADYDDDDFERLLQLADWLQSNRNSNLYPRQLPVIGVDSKWFEQHKSAVVNLLSQAKCSAENANTTEPNDAIAEETTNDDTASNAATDVYEICGLRRLPELLRLRILDADLRKQIGELSDITAPLSDLLSLPFCNARVFIVENLQTLLSFDDLPGSIVIMGMGYSVLKLKALPWITQTNCYYWGDLDTHGFAILNSARSFLPGLRSILMDEATLLRHKDLCVPEKSQHGTDALSNLTADEQSVYSGLKQQRWGTNLRLEQERIPWDYAWAAIIRL